MRSLRLPSEDPRIERPLNMKGQVRPPRIERPLNMKGQIRPPEMICQGFMPLEHVYVEEQTCSCKNNDKQVPK